MTPNRRHVVVACLVALAALLLPHSTHAQTYPNRPINYIVPSSPGSSPDIVGRIMAEALAKILGQPVVVLNRAGAGGTIAAAVTAKADPDGYTVLQANANHAFSHTLYKNLSYDLEKDFVPVGRFASAFYIILAHPKVGVKTLKELIAKAKAEPGKLNYASGGIGAATFIVTEVLKAQAQIDMVHVPYNGGGHSSQAVIAGDVEMTFENPATSLPLVQGGQLRALAVTNDTRNRQAPEIPTMIEAGVPDFVSVSFTGIVAPAGTPPMVVARLNAAIVESMKSAEVQAALDKLGVDTRVGTPEEFSSFLGHEREKWGALIRAANIKPE